MCNSIYKFTSDHYIRKVHTMCVSSWRKIAGMRGMTEKEEDGSDPFNSHTTRPNISKIPIPIEDPRYISPTGEFDKFRVLPDRRKYVSLQFIPEQLVFVVSGFYLSRERSTQRAGILAVVHTLLEIHSGLLRVVSTSKAPLLILFVFAFHQICVGVYRLCFLHTKDN